MKLFVFVKPLIAFFKRIFYPEYQLHIITAYARPILGYKSMIKLCKNRHTIRKAESQSQLDAEINFFVKMVNPILINICNLIINTLF